MLRITSVVVMTALALLMALPARADGLQTIATFQSGDAKLSLDTYTEGSGTVGLIGITIGSQTSSYSFEKADLSALYALWDKGQALSGEKYLAAGSVAETTTHALDVLLLAGGPGVRFSVADPVDGLVSFDLSRADYASFDAALHKTGDALTL